MGWSARKALYQQMSAQIDNGRPMLDALEDFRGRLQRRGRKKLAAAVHRTALSIKDGKTLVVSLGPSLTPMERSVLNSGEKAGQLSQSMRLILDVRERTGRITRKVMGYFTSPVVYLITLMVALYVIGTSVNPPLAQVVPYKDWTGWAYAMYLMGAVATGPGLMITGAVIATLCAGVYFSLPKWTGAGRAFFDQHVFPYTVYRDIQGFTWLLSFTALLRAGVSDTAALEDQIKTATPWMASRLRPALSGLRDGLNLSAALRRTGYGFPSLDLIDEIGAYVSFPDFPEKIDYAAKAYSEVLERHLMVLGGMVAGVFSMGMFLAFGIITMGSNTISTLIQATMGAH